MNYFCKILIERVEILLSVVFKFDKLEFFAIERFLLSVPALSNHNTLFFVEYEFNQVDFFWLFQSVVVAKRVEILHIFDKRKLLNDNVRFILNNNN